MARVTNAAITYNDANYMIANEGFTLAGQYIASDRCLVRAAVELYFGNVDSSNFSSYANNRLVPYHLIQPTGGSFSVTKIAGTGASISGTKSTWNVPQNITAADLSDAQNFPPDNDYCNPLRGTNFNFSIPTGATIDGITLKIRRAPNSGATLGEISDYDTYLALSGVKKGISKPNVSSWNHLAYEIITYGGSSDLWNTTWTVSDINNSTFGADLVIQKSGTGFNGGYVDYFEITIDYTV